MTDDTLVAEVKQHLLEHVAVAASQTLSPSMLDKLEVRVMKEVYRQIGADLLAQLTTYVQAEKLADETKDFHFSWCRSRWQARKLCIPSRWTRWFWHPFVRHFPPKYFTAKATVEVRSWATFPDSTLIIPELGNMVPLQQITARSSKDNPWSQG